MLKRLVVADAAQFVRRVSQATGRSDSQRDGNRYPSRSRRIPTAHLSAKLDANGTRGSKSNSVMRPAALTGSFPIHQSNVNAKSGATAGDLSQYRPPGWADPGHSVAPAGIAMSVESTIGSQVIAVGAAIRV